MINAIRKMRFFPLYKLGIVWSMKLTWYDHIEQKCKNLGNIFLVLQVSRLVVEVTTSLPLHPPTTSASSEMLSVFFSIRPWFFGPVAPILKTGARCAPLKSMDFHRRFAQENVPRATTGLSSTFSFKFSAHFDAPTFSFRHQTVLQFEIVPRETRSRRCKNPRRKGGEDPGHNGDGDGSSRWREIVPHKIRDWDVKDSSRRGLCSTVRSLTCYFLPPFSHFFLA